MFDMGMGFVIGPEEIIIFLLVIAAIIIFVVKSQRGGEKVPQSESHIDHSVADSSTSPQQSHQQKGDIDKCPNCEKSVAPDSFFCAWCGIFLPAPEKGRKANLFVRLAALVIDPLIAIILYFAALGIFGSIYSSLGALMAFLFPVAYLIWFLKLLRQGLTPGKKLLGLQVIRAQTGQYPGFGFMFLREIVGRILSALFGGLGYLWALFDKNAQAWHDKLAETVVVQVPRNQ